MSSVSRALVGAALACLVLGMAVGVLLAAPGVDPAWRTALRPAWVHLLAVGWLTQLVFGVALWLFPRRRQLRHQSPLAWSGLVLLNAGVAARTVAEPALALAHGPPWGALAAVAAVLQWLAVLLFVACLWPRVRGR